MKKNILKINIKNPKNELKKIEIDLNYYCVKSLKIN